MQTEFFTETLQDEKKRIRDEMWNKGTHCKACGQFAKGYKRQVHSTMAAALIWFYKKTRFDPHSYFHNTIILKGFPTLWGDFSKLSAWGLIHEKPKEESDVRGGRTSGFWKVTDIGISFIKRQIKIKKHAFIYNDEVIGFSDDEVGIDDCLKKRFKYEELMRS